MLLSAMLPAVAIRSMQEARHKGKGGASGIAYAFPSVHIFQASVHRARFFRLHRIFASCWIRISQLPATFSHLYLFIRPISRTRLLIRPARPLQSDLVGFTKLGSEIEPEDLLAMLHELFTVRDHLSPTSPVCLSRPSRIGA